MLDKFKKTSFRTKAIAVTVAISIVIGAVGIGINRAALGTKTITSPQTFDCGGQTITSIIVKNTYDVIIQNCTVSGSSGRGISIDDSSFVTIRNVTITKIGPQSGAISLNASASGKVHDILIEDYHAIGGGSMGWAIGGSQYPISNITVRDCLIEGVGNPGEVQTHGVYASNWQNFLIEDCTILDSWNTGLKLVGDIGPGTIRNVIIKRSGRAGVSGPCIAMGDGRRSNIHDITIEFSTCENNLQIAIAVYETNLPVLRITLRNNYFLNNQRAVIVQPLSKGWSITNNVGWNKASYGPGRELVYLYNMGLLSDNFFDGNIWCFDGKNPFSIGGNTYNLAQWQGFGADLHSSSQCPPTISLTPTTLTQMPATPTRTLTKIPTRTITSTNTVLAPTRTRTPTFTPSPTRTRTPTFTPSSTFSPVPSVTFTEIPSFTPTLTQTLIFTESPIVTSSVTQMPISTLTLPLTPTPTPTVTPTRTPAPTPSPNRCDYNKDGRVTFWESVRCWFETR